MRRILLALTLPVMCLSMHAGTTGRITGKILNKQGKAIPGAKINLKRTDFNWSMDLLPNKAGAYIQVGLEPKEYDLTASAPGYVDHKERITIPLDNQLLKDITLLTPEEARAQSVSPGAQAVQEDPGAALDIAGREAFNLAIPFYNEGKFAAALPLVEKAYKSLTEAKEKMKDEQAKADLSPEILKIERVLGICLAQGGAKKEDGEPYLLKALQRNPKDELVIAALIQTSKAKNDKAAEDKYSGMLETLRGPSPDSTYNKAVEDFNAGKNKESKAHLVKTLELDPKYAEAHFLLAMVEFGENNLRGTKMHLQKYVELAPTGKNAATAKEMLKDPSLRNLK